jgi:hypothetical protein
MAPVARVRYNGATLQTQLRYQTDREICATWGPVVIRICDGARTEIDDLRRLDLVFDELLETRADIAMLLVYTHGTPMPDAVTQHYAADSMRNYGERLGLIVAALGMGFWAMTVRSTLGAFARAIGRSVWLEDTVEQASARLSTNLIGIDADALTVAYRELWNDLVRDSRRTG